MTLKIKKVVRLQSLSSEVSEKLQTILKSGEIKIGEKLPSEQKLGELFGVSRTVVREAWRAPSRVAETSGSSQDVKMPRRQSQCHHVMNQQNTDEPRFSDRRSRPEHHARHRVSFPATCPPPRRRRSRRVSSVSSVAAARAASPRAASSRSRARARTSRNRRHAQPRL